MQSSQFGLFVNSRPFEPFRVFVADGRFVDVTHPEMVLVGQYALALWIFYADGQFEMIDGNLITALKTLGPVDPDGFTGSTQQAG
ncbi:MAG TPA: hypothetical protein VH518_09315 [Tepidisphaeraceae bacterium]|jgi:hypothetical protein